MSNGYTSPVLTREGMSSFELKVIRFDPYQRPVKHIQAHDKCHNSRRLTFLDKDMQEIAHFDPTGYYQREGTIHTLLDNE